MLMCINLVARHIKTCFYKKSGLQYVNKAEETNFRSSLYQNLLGQASMVGWVTSVHLMAAITPGLIPSSVTMQKTSGSNVPHTTHSRSRQSHIPSPQRLHQGCNKRSGRHSVRSILQRAQDTIGQAPVQTARSVTNCTSPITSTCTEDTHQSHTLVTHRLVATDPSTTEDPQPHLSSVSLASSNDTEPLVSYTPPLHCYIQRIRRGKYMKFDHLLTHTEPVPGQTWQLYRPFKKHSKHKVSLTYNHG